MRNENIVTEEKSKEQCVSCGAHLHDEGAIEHDGSEYCPPCMVRHVYDKHYSCACDSFPKEGESNQWIPVSKCEPGRRGRQEIIMGILQMARYGSTVTHLISRVNLSTSQCNKYISELKAAGYIIENSNVFKTTTKGLHVIDACAVCHGLMNLK